MALFGALAPSTCSLLLAFLAMSVPGERVDVHFLRSLTAQMSADASGTADARVAAENPVQQTLLYCWRGLTSFNGSPGDVRRGPRVGKPGTAGTAGGHGLVWVTSI